VEIVNFVGVDGYSVLKRERPTQASQYAEWVGWNYEKKTCWEEKNPLIKLIQWR